MSLFSSKILLFGEYSIIKNSKGLAIPYDLFQGALSFTNDQQNKKDLILSQFCTFLKKLQLSKDLLFKFDFLSFEFDISQGLIFNSTIPWGFGLGSSGALCAAVYERYSEEGTRENSRDNLKKEDLLRLKKIFSQMESFFHGSSSGFDPLISYYNHPILIKGLQDLEFPQIPFSSEGEGGLFILNTGGPRKTGPLVKLFLEKCKDPMFDNLCHDVLLPLTDKCILSFLSEDKRGLFSNFTQLSRFQLENFNPMIPDALEKTWQSGLNSGDFALKLCGAGGGGFLLGMASNIENVKTHLKEYEIRPIFKFL